MATRFTSLGVKNTLVVGGLATLASVLITTATITTLGVTTANITTANVQTLSGSTIKAMQANGVVRAKTVSGAALNLGGSGIATNRVLCVKSTGAVGTYTVTATGTLATATCQ